MITVSAPGKLLLLGDHAVVYGYPLLVTAVNERLSVSIEKTPSQSVEIYAPDSPDTRFVDKAIAVVCDRLGVSQKGLRITTKSSFTGIYGFGSSSAVTVATVHALYAFFGNELSKKELFTTAWEIVQSVQTVGSGFDVAAASFGGTISYVKGGGHLEEVPFLDQSVCLVVGYSGQKANTVALVKEVAQKREKQKEKVDRIFAAIGQLVLEAEKAMREGDWQKVGTYMNFNQNYLENLGVSNAKLESLTTAANESGAYGAKLSGAGGGDCMIALCPIAKKTAVEQAITNAGGQVLAVSPNAPGSQREKEHIKEESMMQTMPVIHSPI